MVEFYGKAIRRSDQLPLYIVLAMVSALLRPSIASDRDLYIRKPNIVASLKNRTSQRNMGITIRRDVSFNTPTNKWVDGLFPQSLIIRYSPSRLFHCLTWSTWQYSDDYLALTRNNLIIDYYKRSNHLKRSAIYDYDWCNQNGYICENLLVSFAYPIPLRRLWRIEKFYGFIIISQHKILHIKIIYSNADTTPLSYKIRTI